jgi:TetR/AcrR family tetracycline transcriptional repressor
MAVRARAAAASRGLSRERIARAALELSDREGVEGLSMRQLARALGVTPMALYVHFRNKDELIDAVVDLAARELTLPSERGPWKRQLVLLMTEIRRSVERHPTALSVRRARPLMSPGVLRGSEVGLRILQRAGLSTADATSAWRALFSYTLGFASFSSEVATEDARRHARAALAALPEDEFPALSAAIPEAVAAMGGDAQFEFGLGCLVDGLEARYLRKRRGKTTSKR